MRSSRLPGKVLFPALETSMLGAMVERVRKASSIDGIIVATTDNPEDDAIVRHCEQLGVGCFRGSEEDVLQRVLDVHEHYESAVIVELTGDCPLMDPLLIDECVECFLQNDFDFVSNCRTSKGIEFFYPDGMDVQVFHLDALRAAAANTHDPVKRQHVTPYIFSSGKFRIHTLKPEDGSLVSRPDLALTLDSIEDYELIKAVFEHFGDVDASLADIIEFLNARPALGSLNRHVPRKDLN